MTQEDKELLLKDLCSRLPYGVKFQGEDSNVYTLDAANYFTLQVEDVVFKPYFRPMSSMTKEERNEAIQFEIYNLGPIGFNWNLLVSNSSKLVSWLNAHHFDYRGLIEKGLALEAPDGMYKNE